MSVEGWSGNWKAEQPTTNGPKQRPITCFVDAGENHLDGIIEKFAKKPVILFGAYLVSGEAG